MISLPLFDDPAPPTVRRPLAQLTFGASAQADWTEHLVSLVVERGLAPRVDVARIAVRGDAAAVEEGGLSGLAGAAAGATAGALGAAGGFGAGSGGASSPPSVALDDAGGIALGYEDQAAVPVFAGTVTRLDHALDGVLRLIVTGASTALARSRPRRSWEQQSSDEIIGDLVAEAGLESGAMEKGVDLAFFAADGHDTAWELIAALAGRAGHVARVDTEGRVTVGPFEIGDPVQTFRYGVDVLDLAVSERTPMPGVTVVGEGAAGAGGADAWSWLVRDPSAVTAEAGAPAGRLLVDGALRSGDGVRIAADFLGARQGRASLGGRLRVPGAPSLVPGGTFAIVDAPTAVMNGEMLAYAVEHRFDAARGFTTQVDFVRAAAPAGPGLGDLVGGLL